MPLYVVRWPHLSAALVRADDEDELIGILDEIDNPDGCTWEEYDGPLFLDFELAATVEVVEAETDDADPAQPLDPALIRVVGVDKLASHQQELMTVTPCEETGDAMIEAICRFAFPATAAVYWEKGYELEPDDLERALKEDAMRLVEYTWRQSHLYRSSDPDDQLAIAMDASPRWVKYQRQRAAEREDEDQDDESEQETSLTGIIADRLDMARAKWLEDGDPRAVRRMLLDTLQLLEDAPVD